MVGWLVVKFRLTDGCKILINSRKKLILVIIQIPYQQYNRTKTIDAKEKVSIIKKIHITRKRKIKTRNMSNIPSI